MENDNRRRFIISNIAKTTVKQHVQSFMNEKPPFVDVNAFAIARDGTYKPLPHGIVEFADADTKDQAMVKCGQKMHGRHVVVEDYLEEDVLRPMFLHSPGLPHHIKRGELEVALKLVAMESVEVSIPLNKVDPRVNKGYAFVFVKSHRAYQRLLAAAAASEIKVGIHVVRLIPGVRGAVI